MDDPVAAQVQAYNSGDVDAFVSCYAVDVAITDGHGNTLVHGHDAIRSSYSALFAAHPDLRAEIVGRQIVGAWTVDHERVSRGGDAIEVLVAYLVEGGLIQRVIMLR